MMVYKLTREAEKRWRRLTGSQQLIRVLENNPTRVQGRSRQTSRLILIPQSHAAAL